MTDSASAATVTIIVVPRERFSVAPRSLRSLVTHTAPPYRLVYVDAGSPAAVRNEIAALASEHGFSVIRIDGPLSPNRARNIGLDAATGEFVVFVDNDVLFTPDWLPPLLHCAKETGAALVSPLILCGEGHKGLIHFGGGDLTIDRAADPAIAAERLRFAGRRIAEVAAQLGRARCDHGEFHCLLARRDMLLRIGRLDEELLSALEHVDLGLAMREAGGTVYIEPRSQVIQYESGEFTLADAAYAGFRWSDEWNRRSLDRFAQKWQLDRNGPLFAAPEPFFARQQKRAGLPLRRVPPLEAPFAQTAIQLFRELRELGYLHDDMAEVQSAYDLAASLFAGVLRPSGKTFLAHVVGTGSVLARFGAPAAVIVAGLLHAAHGHGQFPVVAGTTYAAQRTWLKRKIGRRAEGLVEAYHCIGFDAADGAASEAEIDGMPLDLAFLTMIRVANEIEDHLDGAWHDTDRWMLPLSPLWPLFERVLGRLGAPAMVETLRRVVRQGSSTRGAAVLPQPMTSSYRHSPETGEKTLLAIRAPARRRALHAADPLAAIPRDAELIGIAMVKNECDIIEAFVRYNLRVLDGLAIINHESSDTTRAILQRLQDEGLPLAILADDEAPLRQARRTNALLGRLRGARTPEFVVPLDADEFLRVGDRAALTAALRACPPGMAPLLAWTTYLPMASDDAAEIDPLRRIRHRRRAEPIPYWKAVMRRPVVDDERYRFGEGNHRIFDSAGRELPWGPIEGVALAHFPVRSADQIRAKLSIGRMAERLSPEREPGQGVWWMTMHDRMAATDLRRPEGLQEFAAGYSAPCAVEPVLDPLPDIPYERLVHTDLIDVDGLARVAHFFDAVVGPAIEAMDRADRLQAELAQTRSTADRTAAFADGNAAAAIARAEAEAAALRQSTSWRITAPLRGAVTLLRAIRPHGSGASSGKS